jgi:DNA repair exonuclease SbcCD ATPase subunit
MKLTKIDVRRLHGRLTMSVPTDRPVLFIGPNGAGKSSLLNAALAVMLCDPSGFGPQPPGAVINIELDGHEHRMTLSKPATHAVDDVPKAAKAVQAEREQVLGVAGRWDLNAFLASSANKRATFVAEEILRTAWSVAEIDRALEVGREATSVLAIMRNVRAAREARNVDADEVAMLKRFETSSQKPLDDLLKVLDLEINETQALVLRLRRAIDQDANDLQQRVLPAGTVAQWRTRADQIGQQLADIGAAQRLSEAAATNAQQAAESLVRLRASLAREESSIADLTTELESLRLVDEADIRAARARVWPTDRRDRVQQAEVDAAAVRDTLRGAQNALAIKEDGERSGRALRRLLVAARTVASFFEGVDDDPELLDAVEEMRQASGEIVMPASADDVAKARTAVQALEVRVFEADALLRRLRADLDAEHKEKNDNEAFINSSISANQRVAVRRPGLERQIAALNDRIKATRADIASTEQQAVQAPVVATVDADLLAALRRERQDAQGKADTLNDAQQAEIQLSERRERLRDIEGIASALRVNRTSVHDARSRLVKQIANPLEQIAGAVARNVLGLDLQVRNGDIVLTRSGAEYHIDTASDGERVVLLAGLAIAVRHRLGGWKHAMIDRLDALTDETRTRFLRELFRLHEEGVIDTLICASHGTAADHTAAKDIGFNIVTVGGSP